MAELKRKGEPVGIGAASCRALLKTFPRRLGGRAPPARRPRAGAGLVPSLGSAWAAASGFSGAEAAAAAVAALEAGAAEPRQRRGPLSGQEDLEKKNFRKIASV